MVAAWLWTIALNGTLGLAGYGVARYALKQPAGLPRTLAAVVVAWAWATLGLEVLGAVGLLARLPLLVWSVAGLLVVAPFWRPVPALKSGAPPAAWEPEAIVALGLVLWVAGLLGAQSVVGPVKVVSDGPIYHLYFAARWWKAGRLIPVAAPFGETAATYFPAVGDLWFTWLITCWGGERLAKVGQAPFQLVVVLAAYGLARRFGVGRTAALLAAAWLATCTPIILYAVEPNVDTIFLAGYLLAAYFFARDALGDDVGPSWALGALAAGCALGTKPTGVVFVPLLLVLAGLGALARPMAGRHVFGRLLALVLLPLATTGYWYGRNLLLTGNPLYPLRLEIAGRVWLTGWYARGAMRYSQYYISAADWRVCVDQLLAVIDPRFMPLWAAALAGAWAWRRRDRPAHPGAVWTCAALAVVNIGLFWGLIPYRTQQRFVYPAIGLSAVPLAALLDRARWLRVLAAALLALHLTTPQGWPLAREGEPLPWDVSPLVQNAFGAPIPIPCTLAKQRAIWAQAATRGALVRVLAIGLGAFATAAVWRVSAYRGQGWRVAAALATVAWTGCTLVLAAPERADPRAGFYPPFPEFVRGWLQLDARSGPHGARVAYAGTDLPYYLLGVGLRNEVRYVNVDAHRDWLMHDYHRAAGYTAWPDSRPGWDRIHPDYAAWLANLRAERIQLLVVTRANPTEGRFNLADAERFPIERVWADAHPETFEPLYGRAEADPWFRLYRVRPPGR